MHHNESLIAAYLLDGKGGGKRIHWKDIETWTPDQGFLWLHLNYSAKNSEQWLKNKSGLNKIISRAMYTEESRPRSVISHEGILMFLRGVNHNPGQDPEDMVSIRVWIENHRVITSRKRKLLSVQDVIDAIDSKTGPKNPIEFLVMLNDRLTDRIGDVVDDVDTIVDELEQEVITSESRLLRVKISENRRQAVSIRRYLAPQREALTRLQLEDSTLIDHDTKIHLREITDRLIRYIEDLDSSRERAAIIQEELSTRLSEQLDQRMYLISVVAIIFLPITFVTGLLGINVGGIPGSKNDWGFAIVCFTLIVIVGLLISLFRYKKWM